jgi:5-methylcytosine-specific restriction protein A
VPNLRPLKPCKRPGCAALVRGGGYCPQHAHLLRAETRERFAPLDARKSPEARAFYSSARWTAASRSHRTKEPLCRRCAARGRVVAGELVHHNPPREVLVARGDSPFDARFFETLCHRCHQRELRAKK